MTSNGVVTHSYSLNDWDEAFAGGLDRLHQGDHGSLTLPPYRCCSHDRRPVRNGGRPVGKRKDMLLL